MPATMPNGWICLELDGGRWLPLSVPICATIKACPRYAVIHCCLPAPATPRPHATRPYSMLHEQPFSAMPGYAACLQQHAHRLPQPVCTCMLLLLRACQPLLSLGAMFPAMSHVQEETVMLDGGWMKDGCCLPSHAPQSATPRSHQPAID